MSARGEMMSEGQGLNVVEHSMQTLQQTKRTTKNRMMRGVLSFLLLFSCATAWADVDLIVNDVSTSATNLPVNGTAMVSTTVKNQGSTAQTAYSFDLGIYLSTDANITTADTRIGSRMVIGLASGASSTDSTSVAIPANLAPGTYYIGAIADYGNSQPETIETNNALAGASIAVVRDVDLIVTAVSTAATNLPVNGTATVSTTVTNQGSTAQTAYSFDLGIYLSTDANITTADTRIGSRMVIGLASGASSTDSTSVAIPANLAPGTYYLGAIADYGNSQPETIETNNALVGATIAVVRDVDLIVTAVSTAATNLPVNGTATVSTTVKNQGSTAQTASSFDLGIYLSTDATITPADTRIGSRMMSGLAAGASSTDSTNVYIPANLAPGTYYLGAIADYGNVQPETIETNNALVGATIGIGITNQPPTVSLTSPSANAVSVAPGSFTLSANAADADGTIAKVEFYANDGTTNTLIGTDTVAPYSYTWSNVAAGSYTITAKATDNQGVVTTSAAVSVTSDQAPSVNLTSPAAGSQITSPSSYTLSADASSLTSTIAKVEFYANDGTTSTLIGTDTTAPYSYTWSNVPVGSYSLTAIVTDALGTATTSAAVSVTAIANVPPTVSLTSPANGTTVTVPGSFTLTATAASTTSTVTKVEFYANNGTTNTLVGTATAVPYSYTWSSVPLGTYSITAQATDTLNGVTTSTPVSVTVNTGIAQAYYIHSDHLDTPRQITDANGNLVWEWQNSDPFGNNVPNQNPSGLGVFEFNKRFTGQYFDKETGLHYNINRYYDPANGGRYTQSDPIGLAGGINTYAYVNGNPLSFVDPKGLAIWDVTDAFEAGAVAGVGGKYVNYTLKSPCIKGKRFIITVKASGISAGLGLECKFCFTAPMKISLGGQFDDRSPEPNPNAFNGGYLNVGAGASFMGFGGDYGDTVLGTAVDLRSWNTNLGFGNVSAEFSGTMGTSTVTKVETESCDCDTKK